MWEKIRVIFTIPELRRKILLTLGLLGIYLASRWLRYRPTDRRPSLDVIGLIVGIVGISAILYGASIASDQGWASTQVVAMFVVGAIGLAAFAVGHARHGPRRIFRRQGAFAQLLRSEFGRIGNPQIGQCAAQQPLGRGEPGVLVFRRGAGHIDRALGQFAQRRVRQVA